MKTPHLLPEPDRLDFAAGVRINGRPFYGLPTTEIRMDEKLKPVERKLDVAQQHAQAALARLKEQGHTDNCVCNLCQAARHCLQSASILGEVYGEDSPSEAIQPDK